MCLIHITSLHSCSSVEISYNICMSQYEKLYLYMLYILYLRILASRTFFKDFTSRKNIALNFVNRHRHFIAIYIAGIENYIFKIDKFFYLFIFYNFQVFIYYKRMYQLLILL